LGLESPEEVNEILKNSLFMLNTYESEGFSENFMRAWSQGKPTISLYFDPEGIIERENLGFYSRNFEQFVSDTQRLIQNDALRNQMGKKAEKIAMDLFDPEENVKRLETFLLKIVES